jgi:hypothetical protein
MSATNGSGTGFRQTQMQDFAFCDQLLDGAGHLFNRDWLIFPKTSLNSTSRKAVWSVYRRLVSCGDRLSPLLSKPQAAKACVQAFAGIAAFSCLMWH